MPRSPQWMDLYQIWFSVSSRKRNQLCEILLQSAHGFRFMDGSKFAISHWLGRSPLTQCWRYRAACDYQETVKTIVMKLDYGTRITCLYFGPNNGPKFTSVVLNCHKNWIVWAHVFILQRYSHRGSTLQCTQGEDVVLCTVYCICNWLVSVDIIQFKLFTPCLQKVSQLMFINNFGKCGPIFKILSPIDS